MMARNCEVSLSHARAKRLLESEIHLMHHPNSVGREIVLMDKYCLWNWVMMWFLRWQKGKSTWMTRQWLLDNSLIDIKLNLEPTISIIANHKLPTKLIYIYNVFYSWSTRPSWLLLASLHRRNPIHDLVAGTSQDLPCSLSDHIDTAISSTSAKVRLQRERSQTIGDLLQSKSKNVDRSTAYLHAFMAVWIVPDTDDDCVLTMDINQVPCLGSFKDCNQQHRPCRPRPIIDRAVLEGCPDS